MNFIVRLVITGAVAFGLTSFLPGVHISSFLAAIFLALSLAILNVFVKPVLVILTLPFTLISFGLFLFVINAVIILIAGSIVTGFKVDSFWWALLFSLLLSIIMSILGAVFKEKQQC